MVDEWMGIVILVPVAPGDSRRFPEAPDLRVVERELPEAIESWKRTERDLSGGDTICDVISRAERDAQSTRRRGRSRYNYLQSLLSLCVTAELRNY